MNIQFQKNPLNFLSVEGETNLGLHFIQRWGMSKDYNMFSYLASETV